ncbi:phage tail protein [Actinokineospora auranticolor]|uniref:Phage tail-like protein n=1 Tax=Actinokineospora auranticolor TaxID=155976 RepID=A0A2S6GT74_9PSEU|nr:phage tail protein [Actinokineospora auranticolor]PPK68455.1 phage tail-like protein [Actinokineospora auranticolor]
MTRAAVPGLVSRRPLGEGLPAVYAADSFVQRLTAGLDDVFAPILATLDNFPAYLTAHLTPEDFVPWLGAWVAAELDPRWAATVSRGAVAGAMASHRARGTARGLVERLWQCAGVRAEVDDGPGCTWSSTSTDLPTEDDDTPPRVTIRVWAAADVDQPRIRALVAAACPWHVDWTIEFHGNGAP